jgi:hypothetical protein
VTPNARITNVSTQVARFSVVRPSLPLRAIYKPGPLAAGMDTTLTIEFVAEKPGDFVDEIVIKSELNTLVMTISAKVVGEVSEGGQGYSGSVAEVSSTEVLRGSSRGYDGGRLGSPNQPLDILIEEKVGVEGFSSPNDV